MGEGSRRVVAVLGFTTAVLLLVWLARSPVPSGNVADDREEPAGAPAVAPKPLEPAPLARPERPPPREVERPGDAVDSETTDGEDMFGDPFAQAWSHVDLEQVRRTMPDNLYFSLSAPTQDEAVQAERRAERDRWNVEYGKILSGTGTEAEIDAYYDLRARLSADYVEFTTYLLDHHRDDLPERDVGLLELARRLHLARLEEIPRQVEQAYERKRKQDDARAAWLADEAEFERALAEPVEPPE